MTGEQTAAIAPADKPLSRRDLGLSVSAWAGILGPVLFTLGFLAQELFRLAEYSPIEEPVSALEAGPNGWIQQVNFVVFGLLTFMFAAGLRLGIRPRREATIGSAPFFVSGVGLLLAAAFPLQEDAAGVTYDPGGHFVAGVVFFFSSAVGFLLLSRAMARDARWSDLAAYAMTAGILALAGFVVLGTLVIPDEAPLHEWAGLIQRAVILVILFPCRIVLSVRLLRIARWPR